MSRGIPDPDATLVAERLANQRLTPGAEGRQEPSGDRPISSAGSPADLVRWLGGVQAQDYPASLWAIGLRLPGVTQVDVEAVVNAGQIVRTWPMRGTLHFVPAEDVRWMLGLLAPRLMAGNAARFRALGLTATELDSAGRILADALVGGRRLTRPAAYGALREGGVDPAGQRGIHFLAELSQRGLLCCGPRDGKQPTFVLLEDWVPASKEPTNQEALATLGRRYFESHGPARAQDFAWWSGLRAADARRAVDAARPALREVGDGRLSGLVSASPPRSRRNPPAAELLPPWDEYLVAYRDRSLGTREVRGGTGLALIGKPVVLIDGQIRGTWRRAISGETVRVNLELWSPLAAAERRAVLDAAERFGRFLGKTVEVAGSPPP